MSDTGEKTRMEILPGEKVWTVERGLSLIEALRDAGFEPETPCGGRGLCGRCRVRVDGRLSPPAPMEEKHLGREGLDSGLRLACMARIEGPVRVWREKRTGGEQILTGGKGRPIEADPAVSKRVIRLDRPSLEDQRSDLDRLRDALGEGSGREQAEGCPGLRAPLALMREVPGVIRREDYRVTATLREGELIDLEPGDTSGLNYGIAFDIGTTTVVGTLVEPATGRELATASELNPQIRYGADLISRINFASGEEGGLDLLQGEIIGALNAIIDSVLDRCELPRTSVYEATVVGNTCMTHLLLGLPPGRLAAAPYVAAVREPVPVPACKLGLEINPRGYLYVLPNIGGYVGADTVGVILATGLEERDELTLAIDIGTNGELVLASPEGVAACSTAAGPAFEGAQITHGMRARDGAVEAVAFGEDLELSVIGDLPPRGICGSGLIDLVAGFVRLGIIDRTGRLREPSDLEGRLPEPLLSRIVEGEEGREFILADHGEGEGEGEGEDNSIRITQGDLRELQLAKGAITAGITILLDEFGVEAGDIEEVLLAGAFGNYVSRESARTIGLVPDLDLDRIRSVGNAASTGARLALISREMRARADEISRRVDYLVLGASSRFQEKFMESMYFPVAE